MHRRRPRAIYRHKRFRLRATLRIWFHAVNDARQRDRIAAVLPGYEIGHRVGSGAFAHVYEARDLRLDRVVAVKQLVVTEFDQDPVTQRRFLTEAQALARLSHPHIVEVHDYREADDLCLLIMEYLGGGTVDQRRHRNALTHQIACAVALAATSGIEHAHRQGIYHRDIKPQNMLFTSDGTLKVADFGVAKMLAGQLTLTDKGEPIGTPDYMAPEQFERSLGQLSAATDIYALATTLYELLANALPFPHDEEISPFAILYSHVHNPPIPLSTAAPDVPAAIADIVMAALATDPAKRPPSAIAFGAALAQATNQAWGPNWHLDQPIEIMGAPAITQALSVAAEQPKNRSNRSAPATEPDAAVHHKPEQADVAPTPDPAPATSTLASPPHAAALVPPRRVEPRGSEIPKPPPPHGHAEPDARAVVATPARTPPIPKRLASPRARQPPGAKRPPAQTRRRFVISALAAVAAAAIFGGLLFAVSDQPHNHGSNNAAGQATSPTTRKSAVRPIPVGNEGGNHHAPIGLSIPGLVSWWKADGNADDSLGPNNGTLVAGGYAPGENDQAFDLGGIDDYVDVPNNPSENITGALSLSAWVNPATVQGDATGGPDIVGKYDTHDRDTSYDLSLEDGNHISMGVTGPNCDWLTPNSPRQAESVQAIPVEQWTQVTGTFTPATERIQILINGRAVPTTLTSSGTVTTVCSSSTDLRIGASEDLEGNISDFFDGLIDDVQLYDVAIGGPVSTTSIESQLGS